MSNAQFFGLQTTCQRLLRVRTTNSRSNEFVVMLPDQLFTDILFVYPNFSVDGLITTGCYNQKLTS